MLRAALRNRSALSRPLVPLGSRGYQLGYDSLTAPKEDLTGKIFLVTGSTDGIGFNTASLLASQNATVLLHGRTSSRVQRAVEAVQQLSGRKRVFGYAYDLASLAAVRELGAHVKEDLSHRFEGAKLSALVNNAGIVNPDREDSKDGLEMTWAVNVAAPFLLTAELLGSIGDRIVNVTSISQADLLDLPEISANFRSYERHGLAAYGQSKLAITMWSLELARRLRAAGSDVAALAVDPGTVHTKLLVEGWGEVAPYVGTQPEQADEEFFAAVDPELRSRSGGFVVSRKLRAPPKQVLDRDTQDALWDLLVRQTGAMYPFLSAPREGSAEEAERAANA